MSTDTAQPLVTLEVYSGRPNPSWPLDGATLSAVTTRVRDLVAEDDAEPVAAPPPVLGYRGFRIEHLGADADAVLVGRGIVTVVRDKKAEHRRDSLNLEGVLLSDADARGFGQLLRAAGAPPPRDAG